MWVTSYRGGHTNISEWKLLLGRERYDDRLVSLTSRMFPSSAWSWCGHSTFKILTSAAPAGRDDKETTGKTLIKSIHTFHCTESIVSRSGKGLQKNTSPQMNRLYMRVLLSSLKSRNNGLLAGQRTRCLKLNFGIFILESCICSSYESLTEIIPLRLRTRRRTHRAVKRPE